AGRAHAVGPAAGWRGGGPRGSRPRAVEPEPHLPELELVAEGQRRDALDPAAVHERPVGRAEILDVPRPTPEGQGRVSARDEVVVEDDRVVDVPPERRDRVEPERRADGWLTAGRGEDDEAPEDRARLLRRGPQVAQEDPDDRPEERVEHSEEQQSQDPDGQDG